MQLQLFKTLMSHDHYVACLIQRVPSIYRHGNKNGPFLIQFSLKIPFKSNQISQKRYNRISSSSFLTLEMEGHIECIALWDTICMAAID